MYPIAPHPRPCPRPQDHELPQLRNGDWLMFTNSGAYTLAGACDFNGIEFTTVGHISIKKKAVVSAAVLCNTGPFLQVPGCGMRPWIWSLKAMRGKQGGWGLGVSVSVAVCS